MRQPKATTSALWCSQMNRNGGIVRRALGFALGITAMFGLAQPALAVAVPVTRAQSTVLAGFDFANYIAVPGAVSAIIVVPKLECKVTPPVGSSIYVGVGIQSVNSYARLDLGCTMHGAAYYYPSLVVDGSTRNIPSDVAPGWGQGRVRSVPERVESDRLGN